MRLLRIGLLFVTLAPPAAVASPAEITAGKALAERWCASCHLVSPEQTTAITDAPPFESVASRSDGDLGWLGGFLADPHPPMPDLSLTRQEIRDLTAYIASLRE